MTHFATDANPRAASGLPTQALVAQPITTIHDKIRHRAYLSTSRRPLCPGMFSLIMHSWSFLPKHGRGRGQTCKQATITCVIPPHDPRPLCCSNENKKQQKIYIHLLSNIRLLHICSCHYIYIECLSRFSRLWCAIFNFQDTSFYNKYDQLHQIVKPINHHGLGCIYTRNDADSSKINLPMKYYWTQMNRSRSLFRPYHSSLCVNMSTMQSRAYYVIFYRNP